jgi:hypothetical protein
VVLLQGIEVDQLVQFLGLDLQQLSLGKGLAVGLHSSLGLQKLRGSDIHILASPTQHISGNDLRHGITVIQVLASCVQ